MANLRIVMRANVIGGFIIEGHSKISVSRQTSDLEWLQDGHRCDVWLYEPATLYSRNALHRS